MATALGGHHLIKQAIRKKKSTFRYRSIDEIEGTTVTSEEASSGETDVDTINAGGSINPSWTALVILSCFRKLVDVIILQLPG